MLGEMMVTELVKGKSLEEAVKISNRAIVEALDGLPPHKIHCSTLAADAPHEAIKSYRDKHADTAQAGEKAVTP